MNRPSLPGAGRPMSLWQGALLVFLAATCLKVWSGGALTADARAQIPDPAQQRLELVAELRRTNELLTDIKALLESGKLHVRLQSADNQAD